MIRLLSLTIPLILIFIGFGLPFFVSGGAGYISSIALILVGGGIFWFIENRTAYMLEKDTVLNRILNITDGPDE